MAQSRQITMALVGCGGIADAHWQGIQTHAQELVVTAVVDIDAARAQAWAERTGSWAFTSLDAALAQGDFEAVDIMLPPHLHEEATLACLAAGKSIVVEKPMATTLEGCKRILTAARDAGRVLMVAEQSQYWPDVTAVRRLVQECAVGEIVTARAMWCEQVAPSQGPQAWRYDKGITGGGICIDGGLHWIRPMRTWLGDVDEVIATVGHPFGQMEGESLAQALFRFRSGVIASFGAYISPILDGVGEEFSILGTGGTIVVEHGREGRVRLHTPAHPEGCSILPDGKRRRSAYGLELADFARAVRHGTPLVAGPEEALADLQTVWAMYRSAESGHWEKVRD